jgi:hypothetical protein
MRSFYICLFCSLVFMTARAQQKKSRVILNLGYQHMNTYTKLFHNLEFTDGGYPTAQDATGFPDINLMYTRRTKNKRLCMVYGIGINQKGFIEKGLASDGSPSNFYPYVSKFKAAYFSMFAGVGYDLVVHKKTTMTVAQLLNPEIYIDAPGNLLTKVPLSTRTAVTFEWAVNNGFALQLTPYFQAAITNYNRQKIVNTSSNYRPYGFGINFGLAFGK